MTRNRRDFSKETKRLAYQRSGGRCESSLVPSLASIGCNRILREGDVNYHHVFACALGGDESLDNCAVLCKTCHAITTRENEQPVIAQDKRVSDLAHNIKNPWRRRLPGARDSEIRKKIDGSIVDRRTGELWRGSQ